MGIFDPPGSENLEDQITAVGPQPVRARAANWILGRVRESRAFSFARFNDGELGAISGALATTSRGVDRVTPFMRKTLRSALQNENPNALVGLPCPRCFRPHYNLAEQLRSPKNKVTFATAIQNGWGVFFQGQLLEAMKSRQLGNLFWVGHDEHNLTEIEKTVGKELQRLSIPRKDGFRATVDKLEGAAEEARSEDLFLLSCGAAARVVALKSSNALADINAPSMLDVGTLFDNITLGIKRGFHQSSKTVCRLCAGNKPTPEPSLRLWIEAKYRQRNRGRSHG